MNKPRNPFNLPGIPGLIHKEIGIHINDLSNKRFVCFV